MLTNKSVKKVKELINLCLPIRLPTEYICVIQHFRCIEKERAPTRSSQRCFAIVEHLVELGALIQIGGCIRIDYNFRRCYMDYTRYHMLQSGRHHNSRRHIMCIRGEWYASYKDYEKSKQ